MWAQRSRDILLGLCPIVVLIGLWHGIAVSGMAPPSLLPLPATVFWRLVQQVQSPTFLGHAGITLARLFSGFLLALVIGVSIGVFAAVNRQLGAMMRPIVRVLAPVPKVALVLVDALFPILLATYFGALAVEPKLVWSARAAGASPLKCVFTVILPAALPSILTGCRIGLVISCIVVFLAEMITSTDGLGHLLVRASRSFQTVDMFVPLISISVLGLLLNAGLNLLRQRLLAGFPAEN
ncbi:ABC transporter permease subunit [Ferrovibrio terrae]|uniref:ABC transporter permease n=1 Tax=Ferrovibrio terrae TaxID=2594003 RepID=UPI00313804D1